MKQDVDKQLEGLFLDLTSKQQKVIDERFGLRGKRRTLQAIGDDLGVTRERVRQIENQGILNLEPRVKKELDWLFKHANDFLEGVGGVRRDDYFVRDIQHIGNITDTDNIGNKLRFIFIVGSMPRFHRGDDNVHSFWYLTDSNKKELLGFLKEALSFFKKHSKEMLLEEKPYLDEFDTFSFGNNVAISKHFDTNVFGDFGLVDWPEICPKVVRDKAYLVLRKREEPLHFCDIASLVTELGIDSKEMHPQTVHNELIKDDRFILVGRGMYGLEEHGFEGGTVREVIERILEESGPLSSEDVVRLVNERKILKQNTILLNLQNRKYFKRLDDGQYHVGEA